MASGGGSSRRPRGRGSSSFNSRSRSSDYRPLPSTDDSEDDNSEQQREQTWEDRQKWLEERRHLERIAQLMGTTSFLLKRHAGLKLWEDGPNYQKVVTYVNNSQCHTDVSLKVVRIHRVWKRDDPKGLFDIPNRMLLWHGTKRENIPKILETGFILPPHTGQMFGPGIYFADRITKSSNYSDSQNTFLLLCEVALGKIYSCAEAHNDCKGAPRGYDSVKGNGTYVPDWTDNGRFMGCLIPYGKTSKCTKYPSHAVQYNEFIVYDPKRIVIRFLVEVEVTRVYTPLDLVTPASSINANSRANGRRGTSVRTNPTMSNHVVPVSRSTASTNVAVTRPQPPPVPYSSQTYYSSYSTPASTSVLTATRNSTSTATPATTLTAARAKASAATRTTTIRIASGGSATITQTQTRQISSTTTINGRHVSTTGYSASAFTSQVSQYSNSTTQATYGSFSSVKANPVSSSRAAAQTVPIRQNGQAAGTVVQASSSPYYITYPAARTPDQRSRANPSSGINSICCPCSIL